MRITTPRVPPDEVRPLRELYRREMNCQIVHDSRHARGWTDAYLLRASKRGRIVPPFRPPRHAGQMPGVRGRKTGD
jgi:hypothetical protein